MQLALTWRQLAVRCCAKASVNPDSGNSSGSICGQLGIILGAQCMHCHCSCCMPGRGLSMPRLLHPGMSVNLPFNLAINHQAFQLSIMASASVSGVQLRLSVLPLHGAHILG